MVSPKENSSPSLLSRLTCRNCWAGYGRTSYGGHPITQQTLPASFLYSTPYIVIPVFAIVTILFIILGIFLVIISDRRYEVRENYHDIHKYQYIPSDPNINVNQGIRSFVIGNITHSQGTRTRVTFNIHQTLKAPVYLYYTLGYFFQNFRDFHDGRSRHLLTGTERRSGDYYECQPFEKPGFLDNSLDTEVQVENNGVSHVLKYDDFVYSPCGMAPWSMFNDSFILYRVENSNNNNNNNNNSNSSTQVENLLMICNTSDFDATGKPLGNSISPNKCKKKGISWEADERIRFKPLQTAINRWSLRYPYNNNNEYLTNGWYANEPGHSLTDPMDYDLQVWLRGAILPNFRKLFRIIDVDLEEGQYILDIDEFFDVTTLQGSKGFLLRSSSWVGQDCYGLGIAFIIVGSISFILGVTFCVEFYLRWRGHKRNLPEPKAHWYIFEPNSVEMRLYYEKRTKRYEIAGNVSDEDING